MFLKVFKIWKNSIFAWGQNLYFCFAIFIIKWYFVHSIRRVFIYIYIYKGNFCRT